MRHSFTFADYNAMFNHFTAEAHSDFSNQLRSRFGEPRWPSERRHLAMLGIRRFGTRREQREDTADDAIILCRLDSDNLPQVCEWPGTTESGHFKEVMNSEGDFRLDPGFYFFKRAMHKGIHPCLAQAGPVIGERAKKGQGYDLTDEKKWEISDGSIHIHGGIINLNRVGNWSAGCQVIAGGWDGPQNKAFIKYVNLAVVAGQTVFPYVLIDEEDL